MSETGEITFVLEDRTKFLIRCRHNWKRCWRVSYTYEYFDGYYEKNMRVTSTKEFRTRRLAEGYIAKERALAQDHMKKNPPTYQKRK